MPDHPPIPDDVRALLFAAAARGRVSIRDLPGYDEPSEEDFRDLGDRFHDALNGLEDRGLVAYPAIGRATPTEAGYAALYDGDIEE